MLPFAHELNTFPEAIEVCEQANISATIQTVKTTYIIHQQGKNSHFSFISFISKCQLSIDFLCRVIAEQIWGNELDLSGIIQVRIMVALGKYRQYSIKRRGAL